MRRVPSWPIEEIAVDVIVVAQAYPGQFSGEALDRLARLAPLARVVVLLGSWCEGEVRSGRPWPGAIRVYWHQWPARCAQELGRLRARALYLLVPAADSHRRGTVSRAGRSAMAPPRRTDRGPLSVVRHAGLAFQGVSPGGVLDGGGGQSPTNLRLVPGLRENRDSPRVSPPPFSTPPAAAARNSTT